MLYARPFDTPQAYRQPTQSRDSREENSPHLPYGIACERSRLLCGRPTRKIERPTRVRVNYRHPRQTCRRHRGRPHFNRLLHSGQPRDATRPPAGLGLRQQCRHRRRGRQSPPPAPLPRPVVAPIRRRLEPVAHRRELARSVPRCN